MTNRSSDETSRHSPTEPEAVRDLLRGFEPGQVEAARYQEAGWLYDTRTPSSRDDPFQGDILPYAELPYVELSGDVFILESRAVLLSHGCDLRDSADWVTLAPVPSLRDYEQFQIETLSATGQEPREANPVLREPIRSRVDALKKNALSNVMYLPAKPGVLEESYVNFSMTIGVRAGLAREWWVGSQRSERIRLAQNGWHLLQVKLALHWCRMESPNDYSRT